jgi:hypothetical protein
MDWYTSRQKTILPLVDNALEFDTDLAVFFGINWEEAHYRNSFFPRVAAPMRRAYALWRDKQYAKARVAVSKASTDYCDWTVAAYDWFDRRVNGHLREQA